MKTWQEIVSGNEDSILVFADRLFTGAQHMPKTDPDKIKTYSESGAFSKPPEARLIAVVNHKDVVYVGIWFKEAA